MPLPVMATLVAGTDGIDLRALQTDDAGRLLVDIESITSGTVTLGTVT